MAQSFAEKSDSNLPESSSSVELRRERLRFSAFSFRRSPAGHCTAEAELEWNESQHYHGRAEGTASPFGDLRLAADATLRAISECARDAISFELIGVKVLRAFDANVVIVSVTARRNGTVHRLLGCHLADDDVLRGAALATLQATNRLLALALPDR